MKGLSYVAHFLLLINLLFSINVTAQSKYEDVVCEGEMPVKLILDNATKAELFYKNLVRDEEGISYSESIQRFIKASIDNHNSNIASGRILYGTDMNEYISRIATKISANVPELKDVELDFFMNRDPSVNAACYYHKEVHINVGLLCHVHSEGELAFIIAHELAHYIQNHSLKSLQNNDTIFGDKKSGYTLSGRLKSLEYSRMNELEADSIGYLLMKKAGYSSDCAVSALNTLFYSDQSYLQGMFDVNKLFNDSYLIPTAYSYHEMINVARDKDYLDEYHTHPNIATRLEQLDRLVDRGDESGVCFVDSLANFNEIQKKARFMHLDLLMLTHDYAEAVYNASCLIQVYPEQFDFINDRLIKALYGLTKFKVNDRLGEIILPINKTPGDKQVLINLVRQLTKKQMLITTIKYIHQYAPNAKDEALYHSMITDLLTEFSVNNKGKSSLFKTEMPEETFVAKCKADMTIASKEERYKLQSELESFYNYGFSHALLNELIQVINEPKIRKKTKVFVLPIYADNIEMSDVVDAVLEFEDTDSMIFQNQLLNSMLELPKTTADYNRSVQNLHWLLELHNLEGLYQPLISISPIEKDDHFNYLIDFMVIQYRTIDKKYVSEHQFYDVSNSHRSAITEIKVAESKLHFSKFFSKYKAEILN